MVDAVKVPQLAKIASRASELQVKYEGVQETLNRGVAEQFQVDLDKVGLIIGHKGANIRKAQQIPGQTASYCDRSNKVMHYIDDFTRV
jgi:hypothetical protein